MRFLLLGGIGYLGGRLARFLQYRGHEVAITTRRALSDVPAWVCADRIYHTDLRDRSELSAALDRVDAVFHLAAPDQETARRNPSEALRFTAEVTWNVIEAATEAKPSPAVIYLSSYHVYGANLRGCVTEETPVAPVHAYALAKQFGEEIVRFFGRRSGTRGMCARLSNAFGAPAGSRITQWSLVFNDLCRQAVTQRVIRLKSSGIQKRNFITMGDSVAALEFLATHQEAWPEDGVIHLGSPICLSIREVADIVAGRASEVLGARPAVVAPPPGPAEHPSELNFVVDRLRRAGFQWENKLEKEVDETLRLCAAMASDSSEFV